MCKTYVKLFASKIICYKNVLLEDVGLLYITIRTQSRKKAKSVPIHIYKTGNTNYYIYVYKYWYKSVNHSIISRRFKNPY